MPAKLIQFPALVATPVVNPKHKAGRWPKGVVSLASTRQSRVWRNAERRAAAQPIEANRKEDGPVSDDIAALKEQVDALLGDAMRLTAKMLQLEDED